MYILKKVLLYVLFLISLSLIVEGFWIMLYNWGDFGDNEFGTALFIFSFSLFMCFILWKNNFFYKR